MVIIMNLMEQNNDKEEHIMRLSEEAKKGNEGQDHKKILIAVLLGIIVILLICICILILFLPVRKAETTTIDIDELQQDITDYAAQQKENDMISDLSDLPEQSAIIVAQSDVTAASDNTEQTDTANPDLIAETTDKTAIVVDIADENDISYTKEFILNEMLPYFAANDLDAVWDLAHLKRYVKLSAGLKGTNSYYYRGDVDASGAPDGTGLAIYENNTYYYGGWSHGVRSGDGRWYRFYIGADDTVIHNKVYQAHSYAGQWSNDLPNGDGAEHYDVDISVLVIRERAIMNVIGHFTDGLYDGEMYANTTDYIGTIEEWEGVASNGVFELWQDMSAIGECSIWRKINDEVYMIVDKNDNKNQGMRELLKPAGDK